MRYFIVALAILLIVTGGLFLNESSTKDSDTQESFAARVDPLLVEALEESDEVDVLISVRNLPIPGSTWSVDSRTRDATERQTRILSALNENDFTLTHQSERAGMLSGSITKRGVEKLTHHPFVLAIDLPLDVGIDGGLISTN